MPQLDPAAEAKEARAILREHHKKAGHIDAPRCPICVQFRGIAEHFEALVSPPPEVLPLPPNLAGQLASAEQQGLLG